MFYLYHIKGVKWGCTKNLEKRLKAQGYTINDCDRIITVGNIDKAADMEKELNISHGYKWDSSLDYRRVKQMAIKGGYECHKKHPDLAKNIGSKNGRMNGINSRWKLQKPVLQFDLQGNFIAEYPGCNYIKNTLGIHANHALRGVKKTAGGFIWKYKS